MNGKVFGENLIALLPFLKTTFEVTLGSLIFSLLLGFLAAKGSFSRFLLLKGISRGYVNLMRCVPPIVFLFVVYYGAPILFQNAFKVDINQLDSIYFAIFALSILHGAGMSELMRAAFLAVDKGQREAAVSIGLSEWQAFYRIVLPQAFVIAIPILGNTIIAMLKDGALAYSIGVIDITGRASYLISMNLGGYVLETYLALALLYWILALGIRSLFRFINERLQGSAKEFGEKAEITERNYQSQKGEAGA